MAIIHREASSCSGSLLLVVERAEKLGHVLKEGYWEHDGLIEVVVCEGCGRSGGYDHGSRVSFGLTDPCSKPSR